MRANRPTTTPSSRRVRQRPRRPARSPLAARPPAAPVEGPLPTDQVNLADEESRIMPVAGGGFEQCYNTQAAVAAGSLLVVAADVVEAPNDKQQLEPMPGKLADLPDELGNVEALLADNGYFSESNVNACASAGIDPLIAMSRDAHHRSLEERFATPPPPEGPTPLAAMHHRLRTPEGKKLYALCNQTWSKCSASSNRCSASASSCCVGSTMCAASGVS